MRLHPHIGKRLRLVGQIMSSHDPNKGEDKDDLSTILNELVKVLMDKSIERIINAFREAFKPALEEVAKINEAIAAIGKNLADFKLSVMKEVVMLRDQLRTLNESIIKLEERITPISETTKINAEEERVVEGQTAEEKRVVAQEANKVQEKIIVQEAKILEEKPEDKKKVKEEKGVAPVSISVEDTEKIKEIARLETRLVKLKGEISILQNLIGVGLGGVEEREALNIKLKEKKEVEERLAALKGGKI